MQHPLEAGIRELNVLREYLQVMALQILYQINGSEALRFGGGTCLRICHNLPRYSEDLDFSLDQKVDVTEIIQHMTKGFAKSNVACELSIPSSVKKKIVLKYWLKFPGFLHPLGYSPHESEKLFMKLEVDQNPPKEGRGESFYVTKFNQYFPIYKSDLPTLFAGKIGAVFDRAYQAMRDFYDLLWYLNQGIEPNYPELQEMNIPVKNRIELIDRLKVKVEGVNPKELVSTLQGLLENAQEVKILHDYPSSFEQATRRFLSA